MTLDAMVEYLRKHDDYILLSHDGPDADGLGAAYCLALALTAIGKKTIVAVSGQIPPKFRFIDQRNLVHSLSEAGLLSGTSAGELPFPASDATPVVLDTHDAAYLGASSAALIGQAGFALFIDHHEQKRASDVLEFIDTSASSSCELVYLIVRRLGIELPLDAAEALYAGIVYDTGSFSYPKTSERTFSCALELVRLGVVPYRIHERMHESSSSGSLLLQKAAISSLELSGGGRIAILKLFKEDFASSGASYEDAEDLVNIPLQDRTVEVSILFKESLEGRLRCSLRSKGKVNVASIAQAFGGGGHKTAAGFTCDSPLALAKDAVLQNITRAMSST
jgi:bifunctional oligoribonuclease and PAP phosphatase NrnA